MSDELTFEETLKQLEDVVAQLERGDSLTLDESLAAFEEGVRLTRLCRKTLDSAELRVQQLVEEEESEPDTSPTKGEGETPHGVESDDDIPF